ncbi:MAG: peptidoglycan editing factor PgeF [Eubacteriales bacterium]|nr:peptidoglycan editing factor PgeF [Eubacteriales bacterium]
MHLQLIYKNDKDVFFLHEDAVPYLSFRALDETGMFPNAFSTRLGGVSEGHLASMNLTYAKEGEKPEHVLENYRRFAASAGFDIGRMVVSQQTHTTNVREVTEADAGMGVLRERSYTDVDGLVTNTPGLTLVTFYADCVPLYIADPVHRAIGLSHSGWRGTVNRMGAVTIRKLSALYNSDPSELICCIGPSICRDCFEVGGEVAAEFEASFGFSRRSELIYRIDQKNGTEEGAVPEGKTAASLTPIGPEEKIDRAKKYYVDLWRANELVFLDAGVLPENIHTTNICTRCNPDVLWSHRKFGTMRGNLAAFLSIK